jgi:peptidoglycan/xylan/chitin deacetylase (PgdA/CDA1 family)
MNGNNWGCIYAADRIASVQHAYAAGHMIGSHTWSHPDLTTFSAAQIQDQMFRMEEAFLRIIGVKPGFLRPPSGYYNKNVQELAAARGQSLALWDWDTGDADGNSTAQSEALYDVVANGKVKNAVILQHETERRPFNLMTRQSFLIAASHSYHRYHAGSVRAQAFQGQGL